MISFGCCEVWETRSVFQGAVGKSKTCPRPRRLSAAGGSKREFRQLSVSKSLTRSVKVPFPPTLESIETVDAWEASIQDRAQAFAVCRFIRCFGHDRTPPLVKHHDERTGAHSARPLA